MRVFVSYSHDNKPHAVRLFHDLRRAGLDPWMDERMARGVEWEKEIFSRIAACETFTWLQSPEANHPDSFVAREIDGARTAGKRLLPILIAGEPEGLLQAVDARGRYWEALQEIIESLKGRAVDSPMQHLARGGSFEEFAAHFGGAVRFSVGPAAYVKIPVLPSAYGMAWLAGPESENVPSSSRVQIPLLVKASGTEADDSLGEVAKFVAARGIQPSILYVEGPRERERFVLNQDQPHIWRDIVELVERVVKTWIKGRHGGVEIYMQGPVALGLPVGMKLREMLPYSIYHHLRPGYAKVFWEEQPH